VIFFFPYVIRIVPPGPDWTAKTTAIGTVAVAAVAVFVALFAEWRGGARVRAANDRADRLLADERTRSDERLEDERARAAVKVREERQISREREQYTEAYKIQVLQGDRAGGSPTDEGHEEPDGLLKVYGAIIINRSAYTITGVDARLRLADGRVAEFAGPVRVTGATQLPDQLSDGMVGLLEGLTHVDRLTPWDVGLRFYSDPMPLALWYPIVRWTDRWGTRWEHRRGEMRMIEPEEPWSA
jgi:hypothetical protein